ncbi:hypothetical protein J3E68DRAFT_316286 [Trichoderma sp. SZMC 28012]
MRRVPGGGLFWSLSLTGTADRDRRRGWYCIVVAERSSRDCHQGSLCGPGRGRGWVGGLDITERKRERRERRATSNERRRSLAARPPSSLFGQFLLSQLLSVTAAHQAVRSRGHVLSRLSSLILLVLLRLPGLQRGTEAYQCETPSAHLLVARCINHGGRSQLRLASHTSSLLACISLYSGSTSQGVVTFLFARSSETAKGRLIEALRETAPRRKISPFGATWHNLRRSTTRGPWIRARSSIESSKLMINARRPRSR